MNSYLTLAYKVLREARQPLSAREILAAAYRLVLVPEHLYGKTQHKTLHARLAEDILARRSRSEFVRTAPGRFFLRELMSGSGVARQQRREYPAALRSEQLKRFDVLCFERDAVMQVSRDHGHVLPFCALERVQSRYKTLATIEPRDGLCVARLIVLPFRENQMLFRRTEQCITAGVCSYIKRSDKTLFSEDRYGVREAVRRVLIEKLYLSPELVQKQQFGISLFPNNWLLNVEAERAEGISAVVAFHCAPELETLSSTETGFYWHENFAGINDLSRFDSWSKSVLQARLVQQKGPTLAALDEVYQLRDGQVL